MKKDQKSNLANMPKHIYSKEMESIKLGSIKCHSSRDSSSIYLKDNLGNMFEFKLFKGEREYQIIFYQIP